MWNESRFFLSLRSGEHSLRSSISLQRNPIGSAAAGEGGGRKENAGGAAASALGTVRWERWWGTQLEIAAVGPSVTRGRSRGPDDLSHI